MNGMDIIFDFQRNCYLKKASYGILSDLLLYLSIIGTRLHDNPWSYRYYHLWYLLLREFNIMEL